MRITRWHRCVWGVMLKLNLRNLGRTHRRLHRLPTAIIHSLILFFLPLSLSWLTVFSLPLYSPWNHLPPNHLDQTLISGFAFKESQIRKCTDHCSSLSLSFTLVQHFSLRSDCYLLHFHQVFQSKFLREKLIFPKSSFLDQTLLSIIRSL